MARSEWNLIQPYLSIPRVSLRTAFWENESCFIVMSQKMFYFISSKFASCKLGPSTPSWQSIHAVSPESSRVSSQSCFRCSALPRPALRRRFKYPGTLGTSLLQQQRARRAPSLAPLSWFLSGVMSRLNIFLEGFCWIIKCPKWSEMHTLSFT